MTDYSENLHGLIRRRVLVNPTVDTPLFGACRSRAILVGCQFRRLFPVSKLHWFLPAMLELSYDV